MIKKWLLIIGFFLTGTLLNTAYAVKVNHLYDATIPVKSQALADRALAIQEAFRDVLIKVSGTAQVLESPTLKPELNSAEKWIQEFGYAASSNTNSQFPYVLSVNFDAGQVNHLLQKANIPVWGQSRPLLLTWINYDATDHPSDLLNSDFKNELVPLLQQEAEKRGIPLIFPTLDVTDLNSISSADVTGFAVAKLTDASRRYLSDGLLIGNVTVASGGITSEWRLVFDNEQRSWTINGSALPTITHILLDNIATTLSAHYAVLTSDTVQTQLTLIIKGLNQSSDFAQLISYLNHLAPVANVNVEQIKGHLIVININLRSSKMDFLKAISLNKNLIPESANSNTDNQPLTFNWMHP